MRSSRPNSGGTARTTTVGSEPRHQAMDFASEIAAGLPKGKRKEFWDSQIGHAEQAIEELDEVTHFKVSLIVEVEAVNEDDALRLAYDKITRLDPGEIDATITED